MSYPGYPGYPQAPGQQPNQPPGQPMYQTTPLSYPMYPGSAAPQSYPYGAAQSYPQQGNAPYPQQSSPYPSGNPSPYPSTTSYPGGAAAYPSTTSPYPSAGAQYPAQSSPYPSGNPSPYPSAGGYPSSGGGFPPSTGGYPPSTGGYPPSTGAYPPTNKPAYTTTSQPSYPATAYPGPMAQASHPGAGYPTVAQGMGQATPLYSNPAHNTHSMKTSTPTVRPANPFNPREDAEILRKAMKGFGTDEKALINVITNRSNDQRQQIAMEFKTLYGKDLISDIKSETSGYFEDALVSLMTPRPEFLAKEVRHALSGIGTVEETLVEILCTGTNYEIRSLCLAYQRLYGTSLESDLAGDTSGSFRRLLVSLCQGNRSEAPHVDQAAAQQDAQQLLRAGELQLGTDESTFNAILCSRSYPQLAQIFMEYFRLTGNDFEQAVRSEFSGDIEAGLLAIVKSVKDKSDFFAEELHKAMAGAGTRDRALIRIIVGRSEIDLGDIKNAFQRKYGKALEEAVASETSNSFKKTLLSILA